MLLSHTSLKSRRGQDSWEIIKWFPRILILLLIVLFCYYLFISFWDIDYDTKTSRSAAIHPKILHSMIFSYANDDCTQNDQRTECIISRPNLIYLDNFNEQNLQRIFYYKKDPPTDTLVQLYTAPFSAKIILQYYDDVQEELIEKELYLNKRDYDFYLEQILLDPYRYGYTTSVTSVTVIDSGINEYRGLLIIEAIVR